MVPVAPTTRLQRRRRRRGKACSRCGSLDTRRFCARCGKPQSPHAVVVSPELERSGLPVPGYVEAWRRYRRTIVRPKSVSVLLWLLCLIFAALSFPLLFVERTWPLCVTGALCGLCVAVGTVLWFIAEMRRIEFRCPRCGDPFVGEPAYASGLPPDPPPSADRCVRCRLPIYAVTPQES